MGPRSHCLGLSRLGLLFLFLLPLLPGCLGAEGRLAHKLFRDLFANYTSALRPVADTDQTLNVTLEVTLSQIIDMDERNQVLTLYLWIRQEWTDAYLRWDPDDYGGLDAIRIPSGLVWRPDIVLYNKYCLPGPLPSPSPPWSCPWFRVGTYPSFPHLTSCYAALEVVPQDPSNLPPAVRGEISEHLASENPLVGMQTGETWPLPPSSFIHWAWRVRQPHGGFLFMLRGLGSSGPLSSFSGPPLALSFAGKYYMATMTMVTFSTALTILIMNLHYCGPSARPVPAWARAFLLGYLARGLCVRERGEPCGKSRRHESPPSPQPPEGGAGPPAGPCHEPRCLCHQEELLHHVATIANTFRSHRAAQHRHEDWKRLARVMDRFFLGIFFSMALVMSLLVLVQAL
ncbi:PREDICTED: neuronal acetylcholine receptor subunit alpha-10 [Myotis brandtii]|uniref:neuronal acetylcholine receptor subunit alpha-10 n=1 Tax=Myotis brandtii TaxID=109478 RepID=UPI000703E7B2|nr:PREDICTED: neuronal acetylcholine receptor subunit alpha-10 [Myotis brandtii]